MNIIKIVTKTLGVTPRSVNNGNAVIVGSVLASALIILGVDYLRKS